MLHSDAKKSIRRLCLVMAAVIITGVFTLSRPQDAAADSSTDAIRDKISAAKKEQERILQEIENAQQQESENYQIMQNYDALSTATMNKIYLTQNLLTQLENQIAMTEADIAATQTNLDETMARYLERVKETYEDGNASYIELILGSESISDFLSRLDRINAIMEYDRDLMKGYEEKTAELEEKKATLSQMQEEQEEEKAQMESDQAYYEQLSKDAANRINSLAAHESTLQEEYQKVLEAENQLVAELDALIARQQQQSQVVYDPNSGFIRPIPAGIGYVSCQYGAPDPIGAKHRGYDIACASGTPILAAASGVVITSGWHYSYGNYIVIDHGSGLSTLYAHCSVLCAYAGQSVAQGETIALVGATGFVTGSHVHVEFRQNGALVNPAGYIPF